MRSVWELDNERRRHSNRPSNDTEAYEPERRRRMETIRNSWTDEQLREREVVCSTVPWSVPEVAVPPGPMPLNDAVYDGFGATETLGRWRKSTAKTVEAALLCLEIEAEHGD